jgi:hypothetical protein
LGFYFRVKSASDLSEALLVWFYHTRESAIRMVKKLVYYS